MNSVMIRIEDVDQSFLSGGKFNPSDESHFELVVEKFRKEGGADSFFTDVHFDGLVVQISQNKDAEKQLESCIELFQLGGYKPAMLRLEPLLDKYPYHVDLLFNYGMALREVGEYQSSIELLSRTTALRPDHVHASVALAVSFQSAGELEKAVEAAKNAYEIRDSDPYVLRTLGSLLEASDDIVSATEMLEKAIELMPSDPQSHLILGKIKTETNPLEAKEHFRTVLEVAPGSSLSQVANTMLKKL